MLLIHARIGADTDVPDVDFLLPIPHRGPTHSLSSAVVVGAAAWVVLSRRRPDTWLGLPAGRLALAQLTDGHELGELRRARLVLARFPVIDRQLRHAGQLAVIGGAQTELCPVRLEPAG